MMQYTLSVIIPAYNEEKAIRSVLDQLHTILNTVDYAYEVIVVDDGSSDGTAAQIDRRRNKLIQHPTNKGYGAALKTGIRHAEGQVIAITDSDGTYPNEEIPCLLAVLQRGEYDMVVGARTGAHVAVPVIRRPAKWAITRLAEFIAHQPIPDLNSGLRLFRRDIVWRFLDLLPDGFSFTTTITLALLSNNYTVKYEPINYYARVGQSKIRPIQDTLNFIGLILRIGLYFAPLKIFLSMAAILFVMALLWGLFTRIILGQLADVSTMVIIVAAVQVAALGFVAELINKRVPNTYKD